MENIINDKILYPRYLYRKNIALELLRNKFQELDNFLEIGAGRGDFIKVLLKEIKTGDIIEFSKPAAAELSKTLKDKQIKVICADFLSYQFNQKYSLIIMLEVLEHIKDDGFALEKINTLLKKNGYLLLSVPAHSKKFNASDKTVGHYRRYDKDELISILEKHNFKIIEFISYGFPVLNLTSYFTNILFKLSANRIKSRRKKEELSKSSGLGYFNFFPCRWLLKIILKIFFSEKIIRCYIFLFRPFCRFDLGDGYLCLARKI